jgi:hypothetical protein
MGMIALSEAERSGPDAQALIAEARAHARQRRLKIAVALVVLAVVAAAGGVIAWAATSPPAATSTRSRPAWLAGGTGIVTGHLAACFGVALPNRPLPVTPGTVVALRGVVTTKKIGPGTWTYVYPQGPAVASQHISNNYDQTFRFALPPGRYVIAGRYDGGSGYGPSSEVAVTTGATIRVNLPDECM